MGVERDADGEEPAIATFTTMRVAVGVLGIALPFVMILSGLASPRIGGPLNSISAYYNSPMKGVYVAILSAVAFFLFCYKGYDHWDNWSCNTAGVLAFAVALFPTKDHWPSEAAWNCILDQDLVDAIHTVCSAAFLLSLALISIFLFTRTRKGQALSREKRMKNLAFVLAGVLMIACLIALLLVNTMDILHLRGTAITLSLETVMLVAFGASWIVKGVF